jgi:hypothetical protein
MFQEERSKKRRANMMTTMKAIKIWEVYDSEGVWNGYYLESEKELAELWARLNNGSVKEGTIYCFI